MREFSLLLLLVLSAAIAPLELAAKNPQRDVYWGEQHVHTSWSFDAFAFGNMLTGPEDFYRYAMGQSITHPAGFDVRITRPLDWGAVTEHSDYMGLIQEAHNPESALRKSSAFLSTALNLGLKGDPLLTFEALSAAMATGHAIDAFTGPEVAAPVWQRVVKAADKYYQPGKFTTFAAFEWTSTPDSNNMHRNVFFLDSAKVPEVPYTTLDSMDPKDLWAWMDRQRAAGNEVLAVSHNGNLSSGLMFPRDVDSKGEPLDERWAGARLRNEPLTELKQGKGQSETTPALSPNDEFAAYEVFEWQLLGAEGRPRLHGSYVRQAYRDGLALRQGMGFNPYRFGVVGGSDSHVTAVPYRQDNYFGMHGTVDASDELRLNGATVLGLNALWVSPAGLSAVWAEDNTRESIFSGLQRREAYATTGVRITLRFFGGWNFNPKLLEKTEWIKQAYDQGVPMGGDLPTASGAAPTFAIWASRDPESANLDRIQVVKGWSRHGQSFETVYDVAWAGNRSPDGMTGKLPAIGSTVDYSSGAYDNSIGAQELKTLWTDPEFDPGVDAFYYVRVLEIPTPRWSTIQAAKLGRIPPSGQGYSPVVQERAWSSPIWYTPGPGAQDAAPDGLRLSELEQQGGVALSDEQIEDLVVGKTIRVRNRVTGREIDILYGVAGQRLVTAINGERANLAGMGSELLHGGSAGYAIKGGRLITNLADSPMEVKIYSLGTKHLAVRSDEFGFVNYEIEVLDN